MGNQRLKEDLFRAMNQNSICLKVVAYIIFLLRKAPE